MCQIKLLINFLKVNIQWDLFFKLLYYVTMHNSAKLQSPPLSVFFFCSCDKVITNRKYTFFCIY